MVGPVDVVCCDPPFSVRTHRGASVTRRYDDVATGASVDGIPYDAWTADDQRVFVETWSPLARRWLLVFSSHDQIPAYERALTDAGRVVFAPVPCVIRGMTVRIAGDGPSSWAVYMLAARTRGMRPLSGTLPGAYVGPRERTKVPGEKPLWLMQSVVRDYCRSVDVICDPCAGRGTTLVAAESLGIQSVGCEPDLTRYRKAHERLGAMNHV